MNIRLLLEEEKFPRNEEGDKQGKNKCSTASAKNIAYLIAPALRNHINGNIVF